MFYFRIADTNTIHMWQGKVEEQKVQYYLFPIPVEDLGDATLNNIEKSIFLMRYIRKAIDDGTMVKA